MNSMTAHDKKFWDPYLAGALSGLVLIGSVGFAGKFFCASTTFVLSTGMIEKIGVFCHGCYLQRT